MRVLVFLYSLLLFISCTKKDNTDVPPVVTPPSTNDIALITTSAVPGELVVAQANFRPAKDTATILVGGKQVMSMVIESNRVVFIMPELTAGTNALIQFQKIGVNKQLPIPVGNYTVITQPDVILNEAMQEQNEIVQNLAEYKNDPIIQFDQQYIQVIQYINQGIAAKYATLNADEKKQVAYVLRSNMRNADDYKMEPLNPLFYARTEAIIPDAEDQAWIRSGLVLALGAVGLTEMATGIAAVAAAIAVAPAPIFGILIGTGAAIAGAWLFLEGVEDVWKAYAEAKALIKMVSKTDQGIVAEATLELEKDVNRSVTFKGTFRTPVQSDASSSNALLKKIVSAIQKVKTAHAKMVEGYQIIKFFFLGNPPDVPADNLQLATQPFSKAIAMQGQKLILNNVSNPAISITYTREDAALIIKATSGTITQETPFSFNVVYTNPTTGSTITENISCLYKVQAPVYKLEYVSGSGQTYIGGGMPSPMIFRIKNITANNYVTNLSAANLSMSATASIGYQDAAFNNLAGYCGNPSPQCYGGYYYVAPNLPPNPPAPYTLNITVALKLNSVTVDSYPITQNITQ